MLTEYIQAALRHARYDILEDGTYFGEIPGFQGVFANAETLDECREQLRTVLEGWLLLSFDRRLPVPVVDGIDLTVNKEVA